MRLCVCAAQPTRPATRLWLIFGLGIRLSASAAATAHAAQKVQEEPSGFGSIISAYYLTVKWYGDMMWYDVICTRSSSPHELSLAKRTPSCVCQKKLEDSWLLLIQNGRNWRIWRGFLGGFTMPWFNPLVFCQQWSFQRYSWSARAQADRGSRHALPSCQPQIWDIPSGND